MSGVAIYVEGGGDSTAGRAKLRRGLNSLLAPVRRHRQARWSVIPCGSKSETIKDFLDAVDNEPDVVNVLLVDADEMVVGSTCQHLRSQSETTEWSTFDEGALHLMVQTMEAWIVSDPEGLAKVYGKGFRANALPSTADLETVAKADIVKALISATKDTKRGRYHKINHIEDVLGALDAARIRTRCKHFDALLVALERYLGGATRGSPQS